MEKKTFMPGITIREKVLRAKVGKGIEKGKISQGELQILKEKAAKYNEVKNIFLEDGKLDKQERIDLHKMLNQGSKTIAQMKRNDFIVPETPESETEGPSDIIIA